MPISAICSNVTQRAAFTDKPQRNLTMIITTGGKMGFDGVPFLPVKFNFFAPFGEAFYVPYFHKDHGPTWNMLIEAKPGDPLDRFGACKSGEQAVELYKQIIKEVIPWDYDWAKNSSSPTRTAG